MKPFLSIIAFTLLTTSLVSAQDYEIKLHYPYKANQRFRYSVVAQESSQSTMSAQQKVVQNQKEELRVEMDSVMTVMEVDDKGRATKESHVIVNFVRQKGAAKEAVLAAGSRVTAWRKDGKPVFEVGDKPAGEEVSKVLTLAISVSEGGATDDEIFGTTERKKVGDSWSINEELAKKDFATKPVAQALEIQKVSGKTTLQNVTKEDDHDVLHLASTMTATLSPAAGGKFSSGTMTLQITAGGKFPANGVEGAQEETGTMNMTVRMSGKPDPNGPTIQMTATAKRTATHKTKPMKP
jgi:hypothetical protein